jgi:hypothetical protein
MKIRWVAVSLVLAVLVFASHPALAAKRNVQIVTLTPLSVSSPVTTANGLQICLSGFNEGSWVTVSVPWVGSTASHSDLNFAYAIDATGGRCFACPPDWTEMALEAGTYTVKTEWSGNGNGFHRGPSATFIVQGN